MRHKYMMRARYGTGVYLKLEKRNCEIRVRLTPIGGDFMRVHFRIGGDNHYFYPSCVMGDQFSSFLRAVYCLYDEEGSSHWLHRKYLEKRFRDVWEYPNKKNGGQFYKTIPITWDEEGSIIKVILSRRSPSAECLPGEVPDPINMEIIYRNGNFQYTVDGRDLCYAVARGYTEAIKKYGFQGYLRSTGMQYMGDSFEKEMELFLFDM